MKKIPAMGPVDMPLAQDGNYTVKYRHGKEDEPDKRFVRVFHV